MIFSGYKKLLTRRHFLSVGSCAALGFSGLRCMFERRGWTTPHQGDIPDGYGPLVPDPHKLLDLPAGFEFRVVSRAGERMDDGLLVPGYADGMCAFAAPDGNTVLIRNHELGPDWFKFGPFGRDNELAGKLDPAFVYDAGYGKTPGLGGTTTLLYDTRERKLLKQYLSLAGTVNNCSGGPTPWNTWISCEETVMRANSLLELDHGYPFEVPAVADGRMARPVPYKAMGRFRREAVAVEPRTGIVYQSEDVDDGCWYRFIPHKYGVLADGGRLQALCIAGRSGLDTRNWDHLPDVSIGAKLPVAWIDVSDVESPNDDLRIRSNAAGAAKFCRAEGMWYGHDSVYFACTTGGRNQRGQIWRYYPSPFEGTPREAEQPGILELFIEPNDSGMIDNADNLTLAPWGDLIVCEDGTGEQFLVGVTPQGNAYKFARNALDGSEFAGVTFSPDGSTLFVNVQQAGLTLAITGPWRKA